MLEKIKTCLLGVGSAIVAFLLFLLCRKNLHDNGKSDASAERVSEELSGTAANLREANKRFTEANRKLEELIESIETTESEN